MDMDYHWQRAQTEQDQAQRATSPAVAEAHRRLAALHVERIKLLDENCGGSDVRRL